MRQSLLLLTAAFMILGWAGIGNAAEAVPPVITYQGVVTDSAGNLLNGIHDFALRIYNDSIGGTMLHEQIYDVVNVQAGQITFELTNMGTNHDLYYLAQDLYVGISVDADPEMTPRTPLTSVPYAFVSSRVNGDVLTSPGALAVPASGGADTAVLIDEGGITLTGSQPASAAGMSVAQQFKIRNTSTNDNVTVSSSDLTITKTTDAPTLKLFNECCNGAAEFRPTKMIWYRIDDPGSFSETGWERYFIHTTAGDAAELTPNMLAFTQTSGVDTGSILNYSGLEVRGGSVDLLDGTNLTVSGTLDLTGGTLDLSSSNLSVGGNLDVGGALTVASGGLFTGGSTLTFSGGGAQSLSLSDAGVVSDLGSVHISDPGLTLESDLTAGSLTLTSGGSLDVATLEENSGAGRLVLRGGSSTSLTVDDAGVLLVDGADDHVTLGTASSGGSLTLSGGTSGGSLTVTADDLALTNPSGDILAGTGTLTFEPSGGGAGGRVHITPDDMTLTDETSSDFTVLHRSSGLTLSDSDAGRGAIYRADGVQLSGPTPELYSAGYHSVSLSYASTNPAMVCDVQATDLCVYDLNDDGALDLVLTSDPTPTVRLSSSTTLRCDGTAEVATCDVSGAATFGSTVDVTGGMTCDGPTSLSDCSVSGTSTYGGAVTVSSTGSFTCDGPTSLASCDVSGAATYGSTLTCTGNATFDSPVTANSDVTVNGALDVLGPKNFVQLHPEDETKEIVYTALEGPEAGTYTRGSSRLVDGEAVIELPESFALVSSANGLTVQVTPRGPVQSMLYVDDVSPQRLVVKASNPADNGVAFDFMINGVRQGYEHRNVIRPRTSVASQ